VARAHSRAKARARSTFVFIHHLVGGDQQARGGAEASRFFEWGGANADGTRGLPRAERLGVANPRSPREAPRDLPYSTGTTTSTRHQERDGIAYQEVPQPGDARGGSARAAGTYGYKAARCSEEPATCV